MSHQDEEELFHNQPTIVELEDLEQDDETGLLDEHQWNDTRPLRPPPTMTQQQKMSYTFVGIFACLTMLIIIIFAYNTLFSKEPETPPPQKPKHTEAIMQLIWPPTYCKVKKQCIPLNSTKITGFVIEDFKRRDENDYTQCFEKNFDETKLKNIRSQLELFWPDLLNDKDLWKKNWENHGKCLPINETIRSEDVYFETILNLYHQKPSSFMKMLETAFNTTFDRDEKMFKLENVQKELSFKVEERQISPVIDCVEIENKSFLNSITLCVKDYQFIECEQKNSKCKEDIIISPYNV